VLTAFGRGYGMLPDDPKEMTGAQTEFLDRTIKGLSQEGRVISVRLALFAEMLKGKPWTPETLKQVGGAEGVGVTFLEETFSARTAPPSYRIHQKAAQAVLKALLPEIGTNIKGNMRSCDELLAVSGYGSRPNEFDELLHILDCELRLISPIEPEGSESDCHTKTQAGEKYFLLTHDYLVPSIREWLTRKQKETRRGRAELRLVDRSSLWNAQPENRHLPSLLEWTNIGLLTKKKDWTEPQRKMMKRAGRVHGVRGVLTFALLSAGILAGIAVRRRVIENQHAAHAADLVQRILDADTAQVPEIVKDMSDHRQWVDSLLRTELEKKSNDPRRKLRTSLALLPVDASQVEYLFSQLIKATTIELPVLRDALKQHQSTLTSRLWVELESAKPGDASLLPTASTLASYDPDDAARWAAAGGKVAQALVSVNAVFLGDWIEALGPVRGKLTAPLAEIFRDRKRPPSEHTMATNILTDYASDDPNLVASLMIDADPKAYAAFFPITQRQEEKTLQFLLAEVAKKAPTSDSDKDAEIVKDRLAERRARAAITLLRMGKADEIMTLLRHSDDPRLKSFIVNWLNPLGANPKLLSAELDRIGSNANPQQVQGQQFMNAVLFHPETSQRRALILALGTYGTEGLTPGEREPLIGKLLALYENDTDAGIHGAAEWTLRQWGQQESLKAKVAALREKKPDKHRWYVNGQGQTFALIDGPVEFQMGSPLNEPDRSMDDVTLRSQTIPRRFFIAAKEVTVEQFQRFLQADLKHEQYNAHEQPSAAQYLVDQYSSPKQGGPMICVSWYAAAAYCNWLSRKENLRECYEPNDKGEYAEGMKIPADALQRTGYRLPTEAEWEYACRAGAITSRYYGLSEELLGQYAWYLANTFGERAQPCGTKMPNDLGLFDMLGNVFEWCHGRSEDYAPPQDAPAQGAPPQDAPVQGANVDDNIKEDIKDTNTRRIRGGTQFYIPPFLRSAIRRSVAPSYRDIFIGFRPCRTHP